MLHWQRFLNNSENVIYNSADSLGLDVLLEHLYQIELVSKISVFKYPK